MSDYTSAHPCQARWYIVSTDLVSEKRTLGKIPLRAKRTAQPD